MTFTVTDIMLTVIAVSLAFGAIQLIRIAERIGGAVKGVEATSRRLGELAPRLEQLLDQATAELHDLRTLTRRTDAVTSDIQAITGEVRHGVTLLGLTRRTRAVLAGARAGIESLRGVDRKTNGKGD